MTKPGDIHLLKLDFHHTRGDMPLYAVVKGKLSVENKANPFDEENARFYITRHVSSLAFREFSKEFPIVLNHAGKDYAGRTYDSMLAFLER